MATTVKELIDYLKTIPLDTELEVLVASDCGYTVCADFVPLDIDQIKGNVTYTALYKSKALIKDSPNYDRQFLEFGEIR